MLVAATGFLALSRPVFAGTFQEELALKIEKTEASLKEREKELSLKRREHNKIRDNLKEAARTGFLGFWRTEKELETLLEAKEEMNKVNREYTKIRREISRLKTKLRKLERERALQERRH